MKSCNENGTELLQLKNEWGLVGRALYDDRTGRKLRDTEERFVFVRPKKEARKRVTLPFSISIIKRINKIAIHSVKHMFNFLSCSLAVTCAFGLDGSGGRVRLVAITVAALLRIDYMFLRFC